jgi:DNA-directed RNA polymerase subunit alpha
MALPLFCVYLGLDIDLRDIVLSNSSFGPNEIRQLATAVSGDYLQFSLLRDSVAELETREDRSPAMAVRLGVCYYLLGRHPRAVETLSNSRVVGRARQRERRSSTGTSSFRRTSSCRVLATISSRIMGMS